MREPSRTVAAKLPHTCCLVHKMLVVLTIKVEGDPLVCNQHVNVGLCTAYGRIPQVHVCATFCNELGKCSSSSFLKAFLVTSSFLLKLTRFFVPFTASMPQ